MSERDGQGWEPLYVCPNGHRWRDESAVDAPLVNIKCPHCGCTANVQTHRAKIARRWKVQPLRTLEADVRPKP